jgi:hypothetical protein
MADYGELVGEAAGRLKAKPAPVFFVRLVSGTLGTVTRWLANDDGVRTRRRRSRGG